jgi:hypothetical protein
MNQRERFYKTIQHEEPDRIMYFTLGFFGNSLNEWESRVEPDLDENQVLIDPTFGDLTIRKWLGTDFLDFAVSTSPYNYPRVEYEGRLNSTVDAYGCISFHGGTYAGKPYSWYIGPYFETLEKREQFYNLHGNPWDEKFTPPESAFTEFHKKMQYLEQQDYPWMPININGSIWEYVFEGLGPRLCSYLMRKDPAKMHQILDENTRQIKFIMKRMLEEGAMVIGIGDDMGQKDRSLLSPKYFEEFLAPHYRELTDMAHKAGAYFWLHSCGNITELLPNIIDAGVDCWQTLEVASGVDFAQVKQKFGDRMTFVGAVDASRILPFGSTEDVEAHVKDRLQIGMPGGGYIIGPSHDIMDVPLDNYLKMRVIIQKYGNYV